MQYFLDQLNDGLIYEGKELNNKTLTIYCKVDRLDYGIKGYKDRTLKDINFGDKFVILVIRLPIYYTDKTKKTTFVHQLTCCEYNSRITKRLEQLILDSSKESSAIGVERTLKKNVCNISDSTILRILKKNNVQKSTMKDMIQSE